MINKLTGSAHHCSTDKTYIARVCGTYPEAHAADTMINKLTGSAHHWHPAARIQLLHCACMWHLSWSAPGMTSPVNTHSIWTITCMSDSQPYATCYALHRSHTTHQHIISSTGNFTSLSTEAFDNRFLYNEGKGIVKHKDRWLGIKKYVNQRQSNQRRKRQNKWVIGERSNGRECKERREVK
jgi:hypothetical protein